MKNFFRNADGEVNTQVVVAMIGATATLSAALLAGIFGLLQLRASSAPPPSPTSIPAPTTPPAAILTVEVDGTAEAPLNEETYFTIISDDAVRVEWSIASFGEDEIDPFRRTDQVFVEPVDESRVGESFTLVVTAFDADGNRATARHRFQIVDQE